MSSLPTFVGMLLPPADVAPAAGDAAAFVAPAVGLPAAAVDVLSALLLPPHAASVIAPATANAAAIEKSLLLFKVLMFTCVTLLLLLPSAQLPGPAWSHRNSNTIGAYGRVVNVRLMGINAG